MFNLHIKNLSFHYPVKGDTMSNKLFNYLTEIDKKETISDFSILKKSLFRNLDETFIILFYARDPEYGLGKRNIFRQCIRWIAKSKNKAWKEKLYNSFDKIRLFGRWDDFFVLMNTGLETKALSFIKSYLKNNPDDNNICKWLPREKSSNKLFAIKLAKHLGMSRKAYRRFLADNTNVVESLICKKKWDQIDYERVPSQAIHKYRWAFMRNDKERFTKFINNKKHHKRYFDDYNYSYKNLVSNGKYS
tara:strand:- start:106 stop:846 length:741 start_codon:yes stop_codon:yes gene_type:complete